MTERMAVLCLSLVLFGIGYNALVAWADRRGYLAGFTWAAVVGGVGVTVAGVVAAFWATELAGWQFGWIALCAFASSGAPMAIGAIGRYVSARRDDQMAMRLLAQVGAPVREI